MDDAMPMDDDAPNVADVPPAPIMAALHYLDYCRLRQAPHYAESAEDAVKLDLDEMRTREAALVALARYFTTFDALTAHQVFEEATELVRAAAAQAEAQAQSAPAPTPVSD